EGSALAGIGLALGVLVGLSGLLGWRGPIARHVPGAAALYRAAGLTTEPASLVVSGLTSERTPDGLAVEGKLTNPNPSRMAVPRLRLAIRDAGSATLTSWTAEAPKRSLAPGETVTFTSRLDKPPAEGHDLSVSFAAERVAVSDAGVRDAR
ncbi:hypothetical protein P7D22_22555, partial [Lichenihabitans sp. Uapishka_5]|uniref:hypothetical protein n=1 Tax=Lichenihabitans sp. Uapishka_5 TaxID=3037302 RepID=UPI0029E826AC